MATIHEARRLAIETLMHNRLTLSDIPVDDLELYLSEDGYVAVYVPMSGHWFVVTYKPRQQPFFAHEESCAFLRREQQR
jgi:hypothetical protein